MSELELISKLNLAIDVVTPLYSIVVIYVILTFWNHREKSHERSDLSFKLTKLQASAEGTSSQFNWKEKIQGRFIQYEISSGFADTWLAVLRKPYAARLIAPSMMLKQQFDYIMTEKEFGVELHYGEPKNDSTLMTLGTSFENTIVSLGVNPEGQRLSFRSWISESEPNCVYTNLTPADPKEKGANITVKREMLDADTVELTWSGFQTDNPNIKGGFVSLQRRVDAK